MGRPPVDAGAVPTGALASGDDVLVDVFVSDAGVIVVLRRRVLLVGRDGGVIREWGAPREISSAAFDGTYLGVADAAALTTLTPALDEVDSVLLTESCADAVIVEPHLLVCGPANTWDRIFYTYDLATSTHVSTSAPYTYRGLRMRRVPGRDAFIAVSGGSPSDFHYYTAEMGGVVYVNESPYHGDFRVTSVYAFNAPDATHVITHQGLLLRIDPCSDGWPSTCFMRDGVLGTLATGEDYVGMETGADGYLYALVGDADRWFNDPVCEMGCAVQRIDVERRVVVASAPFATPMEQLVAFRRDAPGGGVIVASHRECDFGRDCTGWMVYRVALP